MTSSLSLLFLSRLLTHLLLSLSLVSSKKISFIISVGHLLLRSTSSHVWLSLSFAITIIMLVLLLTLRLTYK